MNTVRALWRSTVGKKAVMALTGMVMFLWLCAHLAGNLLIFWGPEVMDGYGAILHSRPWLLWPIRFGLIACVGLHIIATVQLTTRARSARPNRYVVNRPLNATLAGRTMRWSGVLLLAFIAFHLVHLKTNLIIPAFAHGSVYHNVVAGLRVPVVALFYLLAIAAVGLHLSHGLFSARRSLGLVNPAHSSLRRPVALALAILLGAGLALIPLAVLGGLLR